MVQKPRAVARTLVIEGGVDIDQPHEATLIALEETVSKLKKTEDGQPAPQLLWKFLLTNVRTGAQLVGDGGEPYVVFAWTSDKTGKHPTDPSRTSKARRFLEALCGELDDDQVCQLIDDGQFLQYPLNRRATAIIDYNEAGTNIVINELRLLRSVPAAAGAFAVRPAAAATDDELQARSF
jgi:hypothetical protein